MDHSVSSARTNLCAPVFANFILQPYLKVSFSNFLNGLKIDTDTASEHCFQG